MLVFLVLEALEMTQSHVKAFKTHSKKLTKIKDNRTGFGERVVFLEGQTLQMSIAGIIRAQT